MNKAKNNQNSTEQAVNYTDLLGAVRCTNMCLNGKVKHYPDHTKALFDLVQCDVCKGKLRRFQAYSNNELKMSGSARTAEESIQIAYNKFGDQVTTWQFKWVD